MHPAASAAGVMSAAPGWLQLVGSGRRRRRRGHRARGVGRALAMTAFHLGMAFLHLGLAFLDQLGHLGALGVVQAIPHGQPLVAHLLGLRTELFARFVGLVDQGMRVELAGVQLRLEQVVALAARRCLLYTSDACRRYSLCRYRWSAYH